MILFFDTETTGLPKNWKAPVTDLDNWPRLVQLAYLIYDFDGNLIHSCNEMIKPKGFTIPADASKVHGITTDIANQRGSNIEEVFELFSIYLKRSIVLVAHNMAYDEKIIGSELIRLGLDNILDSKEKICTMESTVNLCKIDGPYGYKWPKLEELHRFLFKYDFDGAHDAKADIQATANCFWELVSRDEISLKNKLQRRSSLVKPKLRFRLIKSKEGEELKITFVKATLIHFESKNENNLQKKCAVFSFIDLNNRLIRTPKIKIPFLLNVDTLLNKNYILKITIDTRNIEFDNKVNCELITILDEKNVDSFELGQDFPLEFYLVDINCEVQNFYIINQEYSLRRISERYNKYSKKLLDDYLKKLNIEFANLRYNRHSWNNWNLKRNYYHGNSGFYNRCSPETLPYKLFFNEIHRDELRSHLTKININIWQGIEIGNSDCFFWDLHIVPIDDFTAALILEYYLVNTFHDPEDDTEYKFLFFIDIFGNSYWPGNIE